MDFEDSAFVPEDAQRQHVAPARPAVTPQVTPPPLQSPPRPTIMDISPPPRPMTPPSPRPPAVPAAAPLPSAAPVAAPAPMATPTPMPAPTAMPTPPPIPAPTPSAPLVTSVAPVIAAKPITPEPASFSPTPETPATPLSTGVSFQPSSEPTPGVQLANQIDQTPQISSNEVAGIVKHDKRRKRLKGLVSIAIFLASVGLAAWLINGFIFQSYYVDGTSMTPTLRNDDRLIIDKVEHTWAGLQGKQYVPGRGQIVVLDSSIVGANGHEEQLIKRVIGLPGDTVIIQDGKVTIKNSDNPNGFDPDEKLGLKLDPTYTAASIELTLGDHQVYVMGDNRSEGGSYDSRSFGPIDTSKLVGRLWARILPLDKAQVF